MFTSKIANVIIVSLLFTMLGLTTSEANAKAVGKPYIYPQTIFMSSGSSSGALYTLKTIVGAPSDAQALPAGSKIVVEVYGCNGSKPTFRISRTIPNAVREDSYSGTVSASILGNDPRYKAHIVTTDGRVVSKNGLLGVAEDYIRRCDLSDRNSYKYFAGWKLEWKPADVYEPPMVEPDADQDGLSDEDELIFDTDSQNPDTDGDGLSDGQEVHEYYSNPLLADTDGDEVPDGNEVLIYKTSPIESDTDQDGLNDGEEITGIRNTIYGYEPTNARVQDSDQDGLTDGQEILQYNSNPNSKDTDGDSIIDGHEVINNTNLLDPLSPDSETDSDGDDLPDRREATGELNTKYDFEPTNPTVMDSDEDDLRDDAEIIEWETDPNNPDTDEDGFPDGNEVARYSDPLDRNDPVVQAVNNSWVKKWSRKVVFNKRKTTAYVAPTVVNALGKTHRAKAFYVWKVKGKTVKNGRYVRLRKSWRGKNIVCIITVRAPTYAPLSHRVSRKYSLR